MSVRTRKTYLSWAPCISSSCFDAATTTAPLHPPQPRLPGRHPDSPGEALREDGPDRSLDEKAISSQ